MAASQVTHVLAQSARGQPSSPLHRDPLWNTLMADRLVSVRSRGARLYPQLTIQRPRTCGWHDGPALRPEPPPRRFAARAARHGRRERPRRAYGPTTARAVSVPVACSIVTLTRCALRPGLADRLVWEHSDYHGAETVPVAAMSTGYPQADPRPGGRSRGLFGTGRPASAAPHGCGP